MSKKIVMIERPILWQDRNRPVFGLPLSFSRYILHEDRLIKSKGLLNIEEDEVMLFRVLDFKVTLSLFQRMFKVGTILISTSDVKNKEVILKNIKVPREVQQLISDRVLEERKKHRVRGYDNIGQADIDDLG